MKKTILLLLSIFVMSYSFAQELPLREIPEAESDYSSGNVVARMVEGLGYRYYWGTEGLRAEDLAYKPSEDARSCRETLEHLYGLSLTIYYTSAGKAVERDAEASSKSWEEMRKLTLEKLDLAAKNFRGMKAEDLEKLKIKFSGRSSGKGIDFWYMINGPIADAIYHSGQIASFRRSSGNPMNPNVNVFRGKTRE